MIRTYLIRLLLAPFAFLYGIGVFIFNGLYALKILDGLSFSVPVISIGNLTVGGAGKTPHTEYLLRLLRPYINVAILSRGYGRKTKGYRRVQRNANAEMVGDEPFMYKLKYPDVEVVVSESRAFAIPQMIANIQNIQTILLDDGFQHRAVKPDVNILLTTYDAPYTQDFLLPAGRLREWRRGARRADAIIVTKCPETLNEEDKKSMIDKVRRRKDQKIFFSKYHYHTPYLLTNPNDRIVLDDRMDVLLVSAIARTEYLVKHLEHKIDGLEIMSFKDHHYYTPYDIEQIAERFKRIQNEHKIILTTEKDATRFHLLVQEIKKHGLSIYLLPAEVKFIDGPYGSFDDYVKNRLLSFTS